MFYPSKKTNFSIIGFLAISGAAAGLFFYMRATGHTPETVVEQTGEAGLGTFTIAMIFLPLAGLPATPFYMLGGAAFGTGKFILVTTLALTVNLTIAYFLGRSVLSPLLEKSSWKVGEKAERLWAKRYSGLYIFLIRIGPGTANMKDYFLGSLNAPFRKYLAISWPISMVYALGFIIMGDSAYVKNIVGIIFGIGLISILAIIFYFIKKKLRRKIEGKWAS